MSHAASNRIQPTGKRLSRSLLCGAMAWACGACDGNVDKSLGSHDLDASEGCGSSRSEGVHSITLDSSGYQRSFHVVVPGGYDERRRYPIVFGFHRRNGTGLGAREEYALEPVADDWALFVYPDARVQPFSDGTTAAGWQNGPATDQISGTEDITFVEDIVAELEASFCVDGNALFATGHAWGAEFSSVLGCYLGEQFLGVVTVAGYNPYYLPLDREDPPCNGTTAAWIFQGKGDEEFPVESGQQHLDFWLEHNGCQTLPMPIAPDGSSDDDDCAEYSCSGPGTRSCWYAAAAGHDIPTGYYAAATVGFFQSLL